MYSAPTLASLLDHQACTLRAQIDGVYDGGVDAVHDARVATRRIRELLALIPVIPKLLGWEGCAEAESRLDAAVIAPAR
jgi:hypothetical protein